MRKSIDLFLLLTLNAGALIAFWSWAAGPIRVFGIYDPSPSNGIALIKEAFPIRIVPPEWTGPAGNVMRNWREDEVFARVWILVFPWLWGNLVLYRRLDGQTVPWRIAMGAVVVELSAIAWGIVWLRS